MRKIKTFQDCSYPILFFHEHVHIVATKVLICHSGPPFPPPPPSFSPSLLPPPPPPPLPLLSVLFSSFSSFLPSLFLEHSLPIHAHVSRAFVLLPGSSGRNLLYSSTSFSIDNTSDCSLLRREGRVSRMWFVSV